MTNKEKQSEVMHKIADVLGESSLSTAEVIGILSILQTTYVLATTPKQ